MLLSGSEHTQNGDTLMSMSKKDYVNMANLLRAHYPHPRGTTLWREQETRTVDSIVDGFIAMASKENKDFDRERFMDAVTPIWHREERGLSKAKHEKGVAVSRPRPTGF